MSHEPDIIEIVHHHRSNILHNLHLLQRYVLSTRKQGGFLPPWAFERLSWLVHQSSFELAVLSRHPETSEVYIYLVRRVDGDYWAGKWHMPGVTLLPFFHREWALAKLMNTEVVTALDIGDSKPRLLFDHSSTERTDGNNVGGGECNPYKEGRGGALHNVYTLWVPWQEPRIGAFYRLSDLPEGTIAHHITMIGELADILNDPLEQIKEVCRAMGIELSVTASDDLGDREWTAEIEPDRIQFIGC